MPSGPVAEKERLARFVYEESYFRPGDGTVKPKAFYPDRFGQCSVVVVTDLAKERIEAYAGEHVTPSRGKVLIGHASVECAAVLREGLHVLYSEPPPNHANINGYAIQKEQWIAQAQELARVSTLRLVSTLPET